MFGCAPAVAHRENKSDRVSNQGTLHFGRPGNTSSYPTTFPVTAGALDTTFSPPHDGFIAKIRPGGDALDYATHVEGVGLVHPAVDEFGNLHAAGFTEFADFPTTMGAFDATHNPGSDSFSSNDGIFFKLDATGSTLLYGTYLGGTNAELLHLAGLGAGGTVYLSGSTWSSDFPTTAGAFDETFGGDVDTFVVKLDLGLEPEPGDPLDCATAAASVEALWPPNHRLAPVSVVGVGGESVVIALTAVRQDEPTDDVGDGSTCPDALIAADTVQLRAERAGPGDGRLYEVDFTATDATGESCSGTVTVCVPHDQGSPTCVDGGALFDSLACGP